MDETELGQRAHALLQPPRFLKDSVRKGEKFQNRISSGSSPI
jgi:hypothetical protein